MYPSATGCPTLPCPSEEDDDDDHLPEYVIILIVFACLLFILIVVVLAIGINRWHSKKVKARRAKQQRLNEYKLNDLGNIYRNGNSDRSKPSRKGFPVMADSDVPRFTTGSEMGSDDVFEPADSERLDNAAMRRKHQKGMFYITSDDSADSVERKRAAEMKTFSSPVGAEPPHSPVSVRGHTSLLTLAKLATQFKPTRANPVNAAHGSQNRDSVDLSSSDPAHPRHRPNKPVRDFSSSRPPRSRSLDDHLIISDDEVLDKMYPESPRPVGLHHWRPMTDLSRPLSSSEPSISHRSSFLGASPVIHRRQPPQYGDPYPPKPARQLAPSKITPQKPKRQKKRPEREPSFMNRIVPPPSLYSSMDNGILYMPEPDYDMSDDSALLPLADRNTVALRGVDNPIFIPDPDYPMYAGYESFDEINGSLV